MKARFVSSVTLIKCSTLNNICHLDLHDINLSKFQKLVLETKGLNVVLDTPSKSCLTLSLRLICCTTNNLRDKIPVYEQVCCLGFSNLI